MNQYEPHHPLQQHWEKASHLVMCLCTMRESCYHCDYESTRKRNDAMRESLKLANEAGYQLYSKPGVFLGSHFDAKPIDMQMKIY